MTTAERIARLESALENLIEAAKTWRDALNEDPEWDGWPEQLEKISGSGAGGVVAQAEAALAKSRALGALTEPTLDQLAFRARLEALGVPGPWKSILQEFIDKFGAVVGSVDVENDPDDTRTYDQDCKIAALITGAVNAAAGYIDA